MALKKDALKQISDLILSMPLSEITDMAERIEDCRAYNEEKKCVIKSTRKITPKILADFASNVEE